MKAEQLQIGDWVGNTYQGLNGKVKSIFPRTYKEYDDIWIDVMAKTVTATFPVGNAAPIPLTKEILELNGWIADEKSATTGYQGCHLMPENLHLSMWPDSNIVKWHNCDISYVHRLQHVLRLCGLNELADNFKIE